eukprot:1360505-Rhodomonas_salina.1
MGLNEEADIQAKKGAAMHWQVDQSWHETDFGGLAGGESKEVRQRILAQGRAGKVQGFSHVQVAATRQPRQYLGELWKGDGHYVKSLALFITFQFPVQANLHRNNPTRAMS